jgi:hypothetical protein
MSTDWTVKPVFSKALGQNKCNLWLKISRKWTIIPFLLSSNKIHITCEVKVENCSYLFVWIELFINELNFKTGNVLPVNTKSMVKWHTMKFCSGQNSGPSADVWYTSIWGKMNSSIVKQKPYIQYWAEKKINQLWFWQSMW